MKMLISLAAIVERQHLFNNVSPLHSQLVCITYVYRMCGCQDNCQGWQTMWSACASKTIRAHGGSNALVQDQVQSRIRLDSWGQVWPSYFSTAHLPSA